MVEGRTLQIWAPSNWKIRIPFSGQRRRPIHEVVIEEDPVPAISVIDYDVTTSKNEDQVYKNNGEENEMINDDIPTPTETFNKVFCHFVSVEYLLFEVRIFVIVDMFEI